jgi:DNA-binding PadR family transcriptional regulator
MHVKTVCLSILYEEEASGYEIRRLCVEGECSYFVDASFGSIYPALAKLEAEGLVTSRTEQQEGRPAKKIYAITEAGRTAFVQSLFEPIEDETFRSPFLLFARFAHLLPKSLVEQRLKEQLAHMDEQTQHLREVLKQHGNRPSDAWVIQYGLSCIGQAREHMRDHMDELIALARPDADVAEAAE